MSINVEWSARGPATIAVVGLVITAGLVFVVGLLSSLGFDDLAGGLLVAVGIVVVTLPLLARQARKESDPRILHLFVAALIVRFAGALARSFVAFTVYGGLSDAAGYHNAGVQLAERFLHSNFETGLTPLTSTNFMKVLTGIVYAVIGPSRLGGYLFFAWLAFLGSFFFYRAFTIALPDGQRRLYAALIFFVPSLLFWPSSIGKEAWLVFTLGLAALGAAHLLKGRLMLGFTLGAVALWLASFVRPHVAGILAISVLIAALVARLPEAKKDFSRLKRGVALAVLVALALILVARTDEFIRTSTRVQSGGLESTLKEVRRRTTQGGSTFSPPILDSPSRAPVAIVTVLYRPLITDAHNVQALISGLEGTFLLLFTLFRLPSLLSALRSVRRRPYVLMSLVFTGLFVVAFSSIANFGLLARERVQLLPFFFVLLTAVPRASVTKRPREPLAASIGGRA